MIAMPSPKKTAVNSLTEITVNQSASNKDTASLTLDPTKPTNVSNVNVPQKNKLKKNDITSMPYLLYLKAQEVSS